jgi:hypothetical protein
MRLVRQFFIFALISCLSAAAQQLIDRPNTASTDTAAATANKDSVPPTGKDAPASAQPNAAQPAKDAATSTGNDAASPASSVSKDAPASVNNTSAQPTENGTTAVASKDVPASARKKDVPATPNKDAGTPVSVIADRIFAQEAKLVENMHHYHPLVETYVQNLKPDPDVVSVPGSDRYFLGRLALGPLGVKDIAFKDHNREAFMYQVLDRLNSFFRMTYHNVGFMQMIFLDDRFDATHYQLKFLRRQFLGEVRTLVFDVAPVSKKWSPRILWDASG